MKHETIGAALLDELCSAAADTGDVAMQHLLRIAKAIGDILETDRLASELHADHAATVTGAP